MKISRVWDFVKLYWPSLVVGAGILYLSLLRAPHIRLDHVANEDKISHMFAYFVFACCITFCMLRDNQSYGKRLVWAIIMPVLFGGLIEILQENFFKPRTGEWMDWYADATGVVLGFIFIDLIYHSLKKYVH